MSLFSDTYFLFVRSMKKLLRNPILLFFSLFQPIIFLLLFTQLFSSYASIRNFTQVTGAATYLAFATPGILLQNAFSSALQSGTSVVSDLDSGMLQKMLVTPVNRAAILLGRLVTDAVRVVAQSLIILVMAFFLGADFKTGVPGVLLMLFTIAFFGLAWSGISLTLGLKTKNAETVFGIGAFLTFPLLFMSTALTPQAFMPAWIQNVSQLNPISYTVNAVRVLSLTGFDWGVIGADYAFIGGLTVLTMGATLYLFRKVVS
ncbi:MAG: ABC transporter permease [archaeon]|nr:MAG: ABC transporter permease [archaeon]